jgi:16S rRNA processing protein RimM
MGEKYRIGRIARGFGMKGEVIVSPDTYDVNRYINLHDVYIGYNETRNEPYTVESVRMHQGRPVIKFDRIDTRSQAENLAGQTLFVDEKERIELPEGVLFIHDIIGMKVFSDDASYVGTVRDVLLLPAHNVYVVEASGREILIPAVDAFIESIDMEAREIRIKPIEGLLE